MKTLKQLTIHGLTLFLFLISFPSEALRLHYQLGSTPTNYKGADWVVVDLFDSNASTVKKLQQAGKFVVCYFSAGTAENWRPDYKSFPKKVVGKKMEDWDGEYWLDVRSPDVLAIHKKRLDRAVQMGCDGVDPDNVDGYQNNTGFSIKSADQVNFLKNLVKEAQARSLEIGLKNATDLASSLAKYFDWIIVEECYKYKECSKYNAFPKSNKPAFMIEYTKFSQKSCDDAKKNGYNLMFADLALKGPFKYCN